MPALNEINLVLEEDNVEKTIALATADEFPAAAMAGTAKKTVNHLFTWAVYDRDPHGVVATKDGSRTTASTSYQPTDVIGVTEEVREDWALTRRGEAAKTHTGHNTTPWQKNEALKQLQMDKEMILLSAQDQVNSDANNNTASLTRGLFNILAPKTGSSMSQSFNPIPDKFRLPNGAFCTKAAAQLTADDFEKMLRCAADRARQKLTLTGLVTSALAQKMALWAFRDMQNSGQHTVMTRHRGEDASFNLVCDLFKFGSGEVRTVVDYYILRNLANGEAQSAHEYTGVFIRPDLLRTYNLQHLRHTDLPEEGQGKSGFWAEDFGFAYRVPSMACVYAPGLAGEESSSSSSASASASASGSSSSSSSSASGG